MSVSSVSSYNWKSVVSEDMSEACPTGTRAHLSIVGLPHDFFTLAGRVNAGSIVRLFEMARIAFAVNKKYILARLAKDHLYLIVACDVWLSPDLHEQAETKWHNWKLDVRSELISFSKRSCIALLSIVDIETGVLLATTTEKYVFVSRKTRTLVELPSWVSSIGRGDPDLRYARLVDYTKPTLIPLNAFWSTYTMMPADCDGMGHVNSRVYIRLCYDVASLACQEHRLKYFQGSLYRYDTKNMKLLYAKETFAGSKVAMVVWQEEGRELTLFFVILHNGRPVFYCNTEFYPADEVGLLAKY